MKVFPFQLPSEDSLILVDCFVQSGYFTLALDTGASHSILDLNALMMLGFQPSQSIRTEYFETANGAVEALVFKVKSFEALGKRVDGFEISAYDFLSTGIVSEFDGMLGLDFFRGSDLLISFLRMEIQVS